MNAREKTKFVRDLIKTTKAEILKNISKMPDEWDGHELRRYIADKFEANVLSLGKPGYYGRPALSRFRKYKNEVAVKGL